MRDQDKTHHDTWCLGAAGLDLKDTLTLRVTVGIDRRG